MKLLIFLTSIFLSAKETHIDSRCQKPLKSPSFIHLWHFSQFLGNKSSPIHLYIMGANIKPMFCVLTQSFRGSVMKLFSKVILPITILVLLGIFYFPGGEKHDDVFDSVGLLDASADQLQATKVVADLEEPIPEKTNVLWCGTFQLAWNEICSLLGEDLHFRGSEPAAVAALNRKLFTKNDLDAASYVVVADYVKNGIYEKIPRELRKKFGEAASPHFLPKKENAPRSDDIVGYAYLFKNLQFENPFERLDQPLIFAGKAIPCFGISEKPKPGQEKLRKQISILYYENHDDFAIELKTKSAGDRLILAKMTPAETLEKTISKCNERAAASMPKKDRLSNLMLKVPKFNFDFTRRYRELEGEPLALQNPTDKLITSAIQNIRFQMNEKGVRLKSESHISIACASNHAPYMDYILVFDKPFLVLLQRSNAKVPYFALWVENAEVLASEKK
jgi:hypothetical protein